MPTFTTVRFGELEYRDQDVILLPEGLVGMADLHRWLILEMGDDVPFKFLQSLDRGDFGFPVSEAWLYHDDYAFDVPAAACRAMENQRTEAVVAMIITTIHPGGVLVTGNLMAPIVIDTDTRRGVQLTLEDPRWSLRQEIDYRKFELAVTEGASENTAKDGLKAQTAGESGSAEASSPQPEAVGV
jgi:flagellar assembly factor FliW